MPGSSAPPAPRDEDVAIFNFHFQPGMLPGWTITRAREVDTGRGIRLIQANAAEDGLNRVARIEVFETANPDEARNLFKETLARFQRDPASILRITPQVGEAEASLGDTAFTFLRGNLVVMVTAIGAAQMPVQSLARQIDASIVKKPAEIARTDADLRDLAGPAPPSIKVFTRRAGGVETTERFAIDRDGVTRRIADPGENPQPGGG